MKLSELKYATPGRAVMHKQLTAGHPDRAVRINRFLSGGRFLDTDGNTWNGEIEGWSVVGEPSTWESTAQLRWSKDGVLQQLWVGRDADGWMPEEWRDVPKEND